MIGVGSGYAPRMYPCCPHCVTDGLDCRRCSPLRAEIHNLKECV